MGTMLILVFSFIVGLMTFLALPFALGFLLAYFIGWHNRE